MARGWESKSVEDQINGSEEPIENQSHKDQRSHEEAERLRHNEVLTLALARVRNQLESASDPRYREQLLGAIASLEAQLAASADDRVSAGTK